MMSMPLPTACAIIGEAGGTSPCAAAPETAAPSWSPMPPPPPGPIDPGIGPAPMPGSMVPPMAPPMAPESWFTEGEGIIDWFGGMPPLIKRLMSGAWPVEVGSMPPIAPCAILAA